MFSFVSCRKDFFSINIIKQSFNAKNALSTLAVGTSSRRTKGLFVPLLHKDVRITTFFWLIEFLQLIY